jgi:hypothetical protein
MLALLEVLGFLCQRPQLNDEWVERRTRKSRGLITSNSDFSSLTGVVWEVNQTDLLSYSLLGLEFCSNPPPLLTIADSEI